MYVCTCLTYIHYNALSVSVLGKLGDLQAALQSFQRALEFAELLEDKVSQDVIKKAIEDINTQIVEELKPNEDNPDN